jgi:uracil-DNA glycosylase family 4
MQRILYPNYFNKPVPAFGPHRAELLVVGLAPGLHGANRTGRPFTGDHAGILLYKTLHQYGFASNAGSAEADDGLRLINCRITNAVKCLPPVNKPELAEIKRCNHFLAAEVMRVSPRAILALGTVAHAAVLRAFDLNRPEYPFAHGAQHVLPREQAHRLIRTRLFDSYHCSRYNTQTRRLTPEMFGEVLSAIRAFLGASR